MTHAHGRTEAMNRPQQGMNCRNFGMNGFFQ
ncbi:hypothetical protein EM595_2576 [Duffyella gerundensis]|uniref:Uncharacterized protein n=1 Tax=Duffyella gerundensis TaxID=1619313 RepID=A0A0U5L8H3_9GAMM|nr:hypothetical protein EM595_2576 [Duffyella gerundensis]